MRAAGGKKLLVDEIALIDPRVMAVVYALMDGRGVIVVHAEPAAWRGPRSTRVRGDRCLQPERARRPDVRRAAVRFVIHIEMTTDWSLCSKLGIGSKIVQVVRNLNEQVRQGRVDGGAAVAGTAPVP